LWFASVFAIYLCCHWFYRQPYFLIEKLPFGQVGGAQLRNFAIKWLRVLLSLVLFCLPVFIAFVPAVRRMPRRYLIISSAALIVGLGLSTFLAVHSLSVRAMLLPPWLMNNLNAGGIMNNYDVLGYRPGILSPPVQVALCALVVVSSCSFLAFVFARDPRTERQQHQSASLSWHQTLWLVVPFTLAYTALLMPRGFFATFASDVLDRYLLPMLPCVIILLVRFYQERVQPQLPILSFAVLTIFALWGIAGIHDLFSMNRARLAAADQVHRSGIPRTQIQTSFEYDYWTQIDVAGHINDPRIHTPKNAYRQVSLSIGPRPPNRFWYAQETAAVQPRYFIVFTPQPSLKATEFAPTSYHTWLPPFGATVIVQQLP
jgi:hypothetical protein